jgi:TRAP-type C4-dicarboxylate transport system permease small subunit
MRNINRSFVGSSEVIVNIIIVVVFLGIGRTSVLNAQIKIDVFSFLPRMDHITLFLTIAMYIVSGIAAFKQAALANQLHLASSFLSIPRWPFLIVTGVGLILCGLGALCVELRFISTQHKARLEKKNSVKEADA